MAKVRLYQKAKNKNEKSGWMLDYYLPNGKRKRQVFWGTKREAVERLSKVQAEIWEVKHGLKKRIKRRLTITELATLYYKHQNNQGYSPLTVKRIGVAVKAFINIMGDISIHHLDREDIERFKVARREQCSIGGVNSDFKHIKAMFNYAYHMAYLDRSPCTGVKRLTNPKETEDVRFLSEREYLSLLQIIKDDGDSSFYDLIRFYLYSGARATQLLPPLFTWNNIEKDRIRLAAMKQSGTRFVFLNDQMKEILESRKEGVLPFDYKYSRVYHKLVDYYKKCGIKNANLNTLRKTCGAVLLQNGWDIYRVSKFLGHSSVTVTEKHYVDLLDKDYVELSDSLSDEFDLSQSYIKDILPEETRQKSRKSGH